MGGTSTDVALLDGAPVTTNEGIDGVGSSTADPWRLRRIKVSGKDNFWAFKIRMRIGFRGYL